MINEKTLALMKRGTYLVNTARAKLVVFVYAALLAAVHFLIYVTLVRFYSAVRDRDATFLAMLSFAGILAAAVLTVDTTFLIFFFVFLLFGVATFVGMELRRGAGQDIRCVNLQ